MWKRCPICKKPEVCKSNLWKLRGMSAAGTTSTAVMGANVLPWIGFSAGGIAPGSIATGWQSSIGNVVGGSLFAKLTSLGMTGYGIIMCGTVLGGLAILAALVAAKKLDWCDCQNDSGKLKSHL